MSEEKLQDIEELEKEQVCEETNEACENEKSQEVNEVEALQEENGKLKTFTSKELSGILKVHQSTVSRAIKNKYVLTEKGIIRIKDLFVLNDTKEVVCGLIEKLILGEDRKKPYTDQEIADYIKGQKIDIARRTIAKYREELGIKSTSKRKIKII